MVPRVRKRRSGHLRWRTPHEREKALPGGLNHVSDGHLGHERRQMGHVGGGLPGADERRGFRHADRGTALPDFEWMLDHVTP
jgi:hypothetical protein